MKRLLICLLTWLHGWIELWLVLLDDDAMLAIREWEESHVSEFDSDETGYRRWPVEVTQTDLAEFPRTEFGRLAKEVIDKLTPEELREEWRKSCGNTDKAQPPNE